MQIEALHQIRNPLVQEAGLSIITVVRQLDIV